MDHEAYKMWKCSDSYEKPIIACKRFAAKAKYCVCACVSAQLLSHVQLFATPWSLAHQSPLSMRSFRWEYWSGLMFPPPGDLPKPRIKPASPASPALAGEFFTSEPSGKAHMWDICCCSVSHSCLTLCSPMDYPRPPCPLQSPGVCSMFIESVMLSNYLILCHSLLLSSSIFPNFRIFSSS